jgi:hypothetical protein
MSLRTISEDKNGQHSLQTNSRSVAEVTSDCSHYRNRADTDRSGPVPSRHTFSFSKGDETELRRFYQCEHLRLITHEEILLNRNVPRRNGNVTYSVNRPLEGRTSETLNWQPSREILKA